MNYLYGDSTTSPLKSNFLEFLRDAIDFSVFALQADERIRLGGERTRALNAEAEAELQRLDRFVGVVSRAIDEGEKGAGDSPTSRCAARLTVMVTEAQHATTEDVRQRLKEAIAHVDAEETASRTACKSALGTLLAPHDLHEATSVVRLTLGAGGTYDAKLTARASFGLEWGFELDMPEGNIWRAPVRVDAVASHLEVRAPQITGWLSKEVKVRPQKLDRHVVTELVDDGTTVKVKLRAEPSIAIGFDVEVDRTTDRVEMTRVGPSDDASVGPFDVHSEDAPALLAVAEKLRASASELKRGTLLSATVEGEEFVALPTFGELVKRFVVATAPIVREISERSLTPNELVIRRALGNDRREEIFVPKATLREKYAVLPAELAAIFAPLGFERTDRPKTIPPAARTDELPPVRAQLAPSQPPPPLPPRLPTARPASSGAPPSAPVGAKPVEVSPDHLVPAADSSSNLVAAPGGTRNEALAAVLKKIATLARNGRLDEAYREYAALYTGPAFADHRPDDQRQALRLMLLAKTAPPKNTDAVLAAYGAAVARLEALIAALKEPADYELLGVAHVLLGDLTAATAAFQAGLDRERERNPQSDLCSSLLRRLSAI